MLRSLLVCVTLALCSSTCSAAQVGVHDQDIESLVSSLRTSKSFWLYFVSVTEKYTLPPDELKRKATVKIYRACGANCTNTLDSVVQHLRKAQPVVCIPGPGMENALLEMSTGKQVVYSHRGLQIKINGHCYLSGVSINKVLDRTDYIFK